MPIVNVHVKNEFADDLPLAHIATKLRLSVATRLSSEDPDGILNPEDVEVHLFENHQDDPVTEFGIEIHIFTYDLPIRRANIQERVGGIVQDMRSVIAGNVRFFVFVTLAPGGFAIG